MRLAPFVPLLAALSCAAASCTIIEREAPSDATPSAGCGGVDHASEGLVRLTIEVEGDTRAYWVRVPEGYDPSFPFPLALMFHGAGGDGPSFYAYDGLVEQAGLDALLVYPDALPAPNDIPTWVAQPGSRDVALIEALLDELAASYCVDTSRVLLAGHSSGGAMASEAACALGSRVRAFASHAGAPLLADSCAAPVRAWLGHATNDPQVPYGQGAAARERWLERNACDAARPSPTSEAACVRYDCDEAPLEWCEPDTFEQVAHDWPEFAAARIWALLGE